MSLVNDNLNGPLSSRTGFGIGNPRRYNVSLETLKAGGAFTTVDINLDDLPAGAVVYSSRIKHDQALAGPSITDADAQLYFDAVALGSGTLDADAAVADGTHVTDITGSGAGNTTTTNKLMMRVSVTGANLSVLTAGSINAWVDYTVLI